MTYETLYHKKDTGTKHGSVGALGYSLLLILLLREDEESSYATTFGTPWGRYRWLRMPFGISPAPEEFQRRLDQALARLNGCKAIADDILVSGGCGANDDEAVKDHDDKLILCSPPTMPRKRGHDSSTLTKNDSELQWDEQVHGAALDETKKILCTTSVLKYFDPSATPTLQCDASMHGLGACLMQDGHPVAYASRSLTPTEVQYAQIKKELLAIVFGMEKFETYLNGRKVLVESDHKPLEEIFKKSLLNAP
ncbi:Retrovirus-related Pol polyprotein from transposon 17.6 [Stylophora pistillata]|uniref:Retrovirus-related Pol polyprotein from transposon 17.6 n=1 Tax=Stylophora pistillata TaxID=50429 RepID=A0A2B4R5S2_STYPI|nr:Retrovirus-related Pol polyprotein from transposon 17.6 [Stylophora pistillata]